MKKYVIVVLVLVLLGGIYYFLNTESEARVTASDFESIQVGTPFTDIERRFGAPKEDIGSGIHIFVYPLSDGSQMLLGFADLQNLLYIKHRLTNGTVEDIKPIVSAQMPPAGAIKKQGTLVCLPVKDESKPYNDICAFGLLDDDGIYFALRDTDPNYKNVSSAPMQVRVEVEGEFAPRDNSEYKDVGIISVTKVTEITFEEITPRD